MFPSVKNSSLAKPDIFLYFVVVVVVVVFLMGEQATFEILEETSNFRLLSFDL